MAQINNFTRLCFENLIVKDHMNVNGTAEFRNAVRFNGTVTFGNLFGRPTGLRGSIAFGPPEDPTCLSGSVKGEIDESGLVRKGGGCLRFIAQKAVQENDLLILVPPIEDPDTKSVEVIPAAGIFDNNTQPPNASVTTAELSVPGFGAFPAPEFLGISPNIRFNLAYGSHTNLGGPNTGALEWARFVPGPAPPGPATLVVPGPTDVGATNGWVMRADSRTYEPQMCYSMDYKAEYPAAFSIDRTIIAESIQENDFTITVTNSRSSTGQYWAFVELRDYAGTDGSKIIVPIVSSSRVVVENAAVTLGFSGNVLTEIRLLTAGFFIENVSLGRLSATVQPADTGSGRAYGFTAALEIAVDPGAADRLIEQNLRVWRCTGAGTFTDFWGDTHTGMRMIDVRFQSPGRTYYYLGEASGDLTVQSPPYELTKTLGAPGPIPGNATGNRPFVCGFNGDNTFSFLTFGEPADTRKSKFFPGQVRTDSLAFPLAILHNEIDLSVSPIQITSDDYTFGNTTITMTAPESVVLVTVNTSGKIEMTSITGMAAPIENVTGEGKVWMIDAYNFNGATPLPLTPFPGINPVEWVFVTDASNGARTDASAGTSGFTVYTVQQGTGALPERTNFFMNGASGATVDGTYFIIDDDVGSVAFWYDVDDSGTAIPGGAAAADRAVEITTVVAGDNSAALALKTAAAVDADAKFSAFNVPDYPPDGAQPQTGPIIDYAPYDFRVGGAVDPEEIALGSAADYQFDSIRHLGAFVAGPNHTTDYEWSLQDFYNLCTARGTNASKTALGRGDVEVLIICNCAQWCGPCTANCISAGEALRTNGGVDYAKVVFVCALYQDIDAQQPAAAIDRRTAIANYATTVDADITGGLVVCADMQLPTGIMGQYNAGGGIPDCFAINLKNNNVQIIAELRGSRDADAWRDVFDNLLAGSDINPPPALNFGRLIYASTSGSTLTSTFTLPQSLETMAATLRGEIIGVAKPAPGPVVFSIMYPIRFQEPTLLPYAARAKNSAAAGEEVEVSVGPYTIETWTGAPLSPGQWLGSNTFTGDVNQSDNAYGNPALGAGVYGIAISATEILRVTGEPGVEI